MNTKITLGAFDIEIKQNNRRNQLLQIVFDHIYINLLKGAVSDQEITDILFDYLTYLVVSWNKHPESVVRDAFVCTISKLLNSKLELSIAVTALLVIVTAVAHKAKEQLYNDEFELAPVTLIPVFAGTGVAIDVPKILRL